MKENILMTPFEFVIVIALSALVLNMIWRGSRFSFCYKFTYNCYKALYRTPYIHIGMYQLNSFADDFINENRICILYARDDKLYFKKLTSLKIKVWKIDYSSLQKIFFEDSELNGSNYEFLTYDYEPESLPYPTNTYLPQTVTIVFYDDKKKYYLSLTTNEYSAYFNATQFDHYVMTHSNVFEYIHLKAPNCEMLHYRAGKKLRSAVPFSQKTTDKA